MLLPLPLSAAIKRILASLLCIYISTLYLFLHENFTLKRLLVIPIPSPLTLQVAKVSTSQKQEPGGGMLLNHIHASC